MKEAKGKRMLSNTLLNGMGFSIKKTFEISSYKKDAANLIANRLIKKVRGYFSNLLDFAAFQEVMTHYLNLN